MALNDYTYSIYDDFVINHKVDITILQDEIKASDIVTVLHHVDANIDEDDCVVWFNSPLTTEEVTILDAIIAAHTGELSSGGDSGDIGTGSGGSGDIQFLFGDDNKDYHFKVKNQSYTIIRKFIFNGTKVLGVPTGIKTIGMGYGCLRLYDVTNNKVLFLWHDKDFGRDYTIYSQSGIEWPEEEAILELQGYKGRNYLYICNLMICFSNNITDNIPPSDNYYDDDD